jgi:hypothetical protein
MDAIQDKKLLQHLANLEKVSDRATFIHRHHVSCVLAAHTHTHMSDVNVFVRSSVGTGQLWLHGGGRRTGHRRRGRYHTTPSSLSLFVC